MKKISQNEIKTEKPDKLLQIVEEILEFNEQNQLEKGLKILTPNQTLSRLPITFAQLKAANNLQNLKMKVDNYCILCIYQKNLQSSSIKVWLTLFKSRNNLYEH